MVALTLPHWGSSVDRRSMFCLPRAVSWTSLQRFLIKLVELLSPFSPQVMLSGSMGDLNHVYDTDCRFLGGDKVKRCLTWSTSFTRYKTCLVSNIVSSSCAFCSAAALCEADRRFCLLGLLTLSSDSRHREARVCGQDSRDNSRSGSWTFLPF